MSFTRYSLQDLKDKFEKHALLCEEEFLKQKEEYEKEKGEPWPHEFFNLPSAFLTMIDAFEVKGE